MIRRIAFVVLLPVVLAACSQAQQAAVNSAIVDGVADVNAAIASACQDYSVVATEAQLLAGLTAVAVPGVGASIATIVGTVNGVCDPAIAQLAPNATDGTTKPFDLSTAVWVGQNTGALQALITQAKAATPQ